jgi:hypothetical protein
MTHFSCWFLPANGHALPDSKKHEKTDRQNILSYKQLTAKT